MAKRSRAKRVMEPLDAILEAAERHGRATEPEHETGDLQDALRLAWALLSAAQREQVRSDYFRDHDSWEE